MVHWVKTLKFLSNSVKKNQKKKNKKTYRLSAVILQNHILLNLPIIGNFKLLFFIFDAPFKYPVVMTTVGEPRT